MWTGFGYFSIIKMLEGKAVVRETDMPEALQSYGMELAYQALDLHEVSDCQSIAHFIKQVFFFTLGVFCPITRIFISNSQCFAKNKTISIHRGNKIEDTSHNP